MVVGRVGEASGYMKETVFSCVYVYGFSAVFSGVGYGGRAGGVCVSRASQLCLGDKWYRTISWEYNGKQDRSCFLALLNFSFMEQSVALLIFHGRSG